MGKGNAILVARGQRMVVAQVRLPSSGMIRAWSAEITMNLAKPRIEIGFAIQAAASGARLPGVGSPSTAGRSRTRRSYGTSTRFCVSTKNTDEPTFASPGSTASPTDRGHGPSRLGGPSAG